MSWCITLLEVGQPVDGLVVTVDEAHSDDFLLSDHSGKVAAKVKEGQTSLNGVLKLAHENKITLTVDGECHFDSDGRIMLVVSEASEDLPEGASINENEDTSESIGEDLSLLHWYQGLIVIRKNKCLLAKGDEWNGYTFPAVLGEGHLGGRATAIEAMEEVVGVEAEAIHIKTALAPLMLYNPKFSTFKNAVATLYPAYVNYLPEPTSSEVDGDSVNRDDSDYDWFTFEEAIQILETKEEKEVLYSLVDNLGRAKQAGCITDNFGAWFGPINSSEVERAVDLQRCQVGSRPMTELANAAQISAAFFMRMNGSIDESAFESLVKSAGQEGSENDLAFTKNVKKVHPETVDCSLQQPKMETKISKLPVTVLSGFLGAGKTTLMESILTSESLNKRVAVIVNDMSEVNVDFNKIKLVHRPEQMVEMSNGCICCTLREDLLIEVGELARSGKFDYLLIESTGISEPLPVAETFTFVDEASGKSLSEIAELDTLVTVVDGYAFKKDLNDHKLSSLQQRGLQASEDDERHVSDLLIDQVEFANVIIINKCDLVSESELNDLKGIMQKLNPDAKIVESVRGNVDFNSIMGTGMFNFDTARQNPGWLRELRGTHVPETEEYGISSFVYRKERPFHPVRLKTMLDSAQAGENELKCLVRSKGVMWIATEDGWMHSVSWTHAGHLFSFEWAQTWWTNISRDDWPEGVSDVVEKHWSDEYGDRHQEIVLIGLHMNKAEVERQLDTALLTDEELNSESWKKSHQLSLGAVESISISEPKIQH